MELYRIAYINNDIVIIYDSDFFVNTRYLGACRLIIRVVRKEGGHGKKRKTCRIPRHIINEPWQCEYIYLTNCKNENNIIKCCIYPSFKESDRPTTRVSSKLKPLRDVRLLRALLH